MVSKAELILDENTYLLNSISYEIDQEVDKFGRPSSKTKGGKIELELYSVDNDVIFDWMIHPRKAINGTINLYEGDNETKLREIKFENAYCIDFTESFDQSAGENLVTKFTISAEKLSIGSVDLENHWLN